MTTRVLVADDSPTIRRRAAATLGDAGYDVTCLEDGTAAWEALQAAEPFAALLCDILMPGLDGYELCRRVKGDERFARLPVLLLRGTFEPWDQARAEQVGADGFVTKPFDPQVLLSTLGEVLAESSAAEWSESSDVADERLVGEASPMPEAATTASPSAALQSAGGGAAPTPEASEEASDVGPDASAEALQDDALIFGASAPETDAAFGSPQRTPEERYAVGAASMGGEAAATVLSEMEADADADTLSDGPLAAPVEVPAVAAPTATAAPLDLASLSEPDVGSWSPGASTHSAPAAAPIASHARPSAPFGADEPFGLGDDGGRHAAPAPAATLDDAAIDRIAERVIARLSTREVEKIAWEVVPDVAEALIRKRLLEIESRLADE